LAIGRLGIARRGCREYTGRDGDAMADAEVVISTGRPAA
jgi:hypothetical protein